MSPFFLIYQQYGDPIIYIWFFVPVPAAIIAAGTGTKKQIKINNWVSMQRRRQKIFQGGAKMNIPGVQKVRYYFKLLITSRIWKI